MAIYELPQDSGINFTEGPDRIFVYVAQQVSSWIPLMLFAMYSIIMLGGYYIEQRQTGRGNIAMWSATAGFIVSILSFYLLLQDGLINVPTVLIVLAVTALSAVWFFGSKERL